MQYFLNIIMIIIIIIVILFPRFTVGIELPIMKLRHSTFYSVSLIYWFYFFLSVCDCQWLACRVDWIAEISLMSTPAVFSWDVMFKHHPFDLPLNSTANITACLLLTVQASQQLLNPVLNFKGDANWEMEIGVETWIGEQSSNVCFFFLFHSHSNKSPLEKTNLSRLLPNMG